jgi:hypothetical protein
MIHVSSFAVLLLPVIEFGLPVVETPSTYAQFFRQIANVVGASHPFCSHPLKLPRVSLPLHFAVLSLQRAHPNCLISRVQSTLKVCPAAYENEGIVRIAAVAKLRTM